MRHKQKTENNGARCGAGLLERINDMCGQCGIILGKRKRPEWEIEKITDIFTDLLLANEHRGRYATGALNLKADGRFDIYKSPTSASVFTASDEYKRLLSGVGSDTTVLMGHTRYPTRGSHLVNYNNHPIVIDAGETQIVGTHNGHISNADELFEAWGYSREFEVDSEIIFRMAQDALSDGSIDTGALARILSRCEGQMSAAIAATSEPNRIVLVKGDKPLKVFYNKDADLILYASVLGSMDWVSGSGGRWREVSIRSMSVAAFDVGRLER